MAPDRAPLLFVITDDECDLESCAGFCEGAHACVDALVLRWPRRTTREVLERARSLAALPLRPALLVSDRADVAIASGCEGVQLREDGLSPAEVRARFPVLRIGASRHDLAGARACAGADHVFVSPVHPTPSKPGVRTLGPAGLERIVRGCDTPVVALGGIDPGRVAEVLRAGARGVAVRSAVWAASDPVTAARRLRAALDSEGLSAIGGSRP